MTAQSAQQTWRQNRAGLAGSLLLHLVALALWLDWSFGHPPPSAPPLKAMFVDLVNLPAVAPGQAGGAPHKAEPRIATAPRAIGIRPNAPAPPPDALEARIAAMANLQEAASPLPAPDNDGSEAGWAMAAAVTPWPTSCGREILRRWWPRLDSQAVRGMPVALTLKMTRAGVISNVQIVDQQRFNNDRLFRNMALSARNAAILASPIPLPPGKYDAVMNIAITLDPKAVLH